LFISSFLSFFLSLIFIIHRGLTTAYLTCLFSKFTKCLFDRQCSSAAIHAFNVSNVSHLIFHHLVTVRCICNYANITLDTYHLCYLLTSSFHRLSSKWKRPGQAGPGQETTNQGKK